MNDKNELITYPWSEENIADFESSLNTAIHYSEKQGNIYLPPYNQIYIMLYSTFLKGLNYSEDYGNYDGACSVTLIESCSVSSCKPNGKDSSTYNVSYWCELHVNTGPVNIKIAKLSQKSEEIAHVLKEFGAKYPNRYDK